ncbi:MAG: hypothetical protein ABI634_12835 [Acidobacteriota bacterium]
MSGQTLLEWRRKGLCLKCGRHPAPDKPHVCQACQITARSEQKRKAGKK